MFVYQVTFSQEELRCRTTAAATTTTSTDIAVRQQMRYNYNGICVSVLKMTQTKKYIYSFVHKIYFRKQMDFLFRSIDFFFF